MDDELRGVKGWLLTFVIIMAVISPLYGTFQVYQSLYSGPITAVGDNPLVASLRTFEWLLLGVSALLCWFVAYRLLAVFNWLSVQIAIAVIWIAGLGGSIAEYVGVSMISGIDVGDIIAEAGPRGIIQPIIFGVIWTSYLLKSERVANTYRDPGEQAEVFE